MGLYIISLLKSTLKANIIEIINKHMITKKNIFLFTSGVLSGIMVMYTVLKTTNKDLFKARYVQTLSNKNDSITFQYLSLKTKLSFFQDQLNAANNNFESEEEKSEVMGKIYEMEKKILNKANTFSDLKIVVDNIQINSPNFVNFPTIIPLKPGTYKRVSSGFGNRNHPILKTVKFHQGLDISAPFGTLVYAPANGQVLEVNANARGYGRKILLGHDFGFKTIFGHLSEFLIKQGDMVKEGQVIGRVGSTGLSTGPHLHYEILKNGFKINPIEFTKITEQKLALMRANN